MPNPRVMEGYVPGVDDDPSSYTYEPVATPMPRQQQAFVPPATAPAPVPPFAPPPQAAVPLVSPMPPIMDEEQGANGPRSVQTPYTGTTGAVAGGSAHKPPNQSGYPPGEPTEDDSRRTCFKWLLIAIIVIIIVVVAVVVLVISLVSSDSSDDGDGGGIDPTPSFATQPVPNREVLQSAVDAYLSGQGLETVRQTYGDIEDWDVSGITDFSELFDATGRNPEAATFASADLSAWNVSSGEKFFAMFQGAVAFNSDLSGWDVGSGTDFSYAFAGATAFNTDLSGWNMRMARTIANMFQGATSFNQNVAGWELTSLESMASVFFGAAAFNQDLCAWGDFLPMDAATSDAFGGTSCPAAGTPTDLMADPPGPLCVECMPMSPTVAPATLPPDGTTCFVSSFELTIAVDNYLAEPSGSLTRGVYGHPIGNWCVSEVPDFSELFDEDRNPLAATL